MEASLQPSRDVELGLSVAWGGQVDFANARPARSSTSAGARSCAASSSTARWTGVPGQYVVPVESRQRDLLSQLLFSYRLDAHTVVLVGYSDTHDATQELARRQRSRTAFVKLSYAWLF